MENDKLGGNILVGKKNYVLEWRSLVEIEGKSIFKR